MRMSRKYIEKKRANTSVLIRKADAFGAVIEAAAREESETDVLRRIDRIPPVVGANVAFLCDGRKCDSCSGECTHTLDVSHAKNFLKRDGAYFENDVPSADITETEACQKCQDITDKILNRQGEEIKRLKSIINVLNRPSAEAVQGEWIKTVNGNSWNTWWVFKCPFCGATIEDKQRRSWEYNFCPNCGAKMKGGDE